MKHAIGRFAAIFGTLAIANSAMALELKGTTFVAPNGPVAAGYTVFADRLAAETKSDLTVQMFFGGSLLGATDVLSGLPDGIADFGLLIPTYFSAEFPEFNLAANMAMAGKNPGAMAGAITEYILTCSECLEEQSRNGHVYLGSFSSTPYYVMGGKGFTSSEEMSGLRLRAGMPSQGRWIEHFKGIRTSIPGSEVFEGISTGLIDGALFAIPELYGINLIEIVKKISLTPAGIFNGNAPFNFGAPQWKELSESQRAAILKVAPDAIAAIVQGYVAEEARAKVEAVGRGIELIEPEAELLQASDAFIKQDLASIISEAERTTQLKGAAQKADRYQALITKWEALVADVADDDAEALANLYRTEIWSKVDPKSYGF